MSDTQMDQLSREDLLRILQRDRFVKEQMAGRVANLMHENLELMAIVQELQETLRGLQDSAAIAGNGDTQVSEPAEVISP